MRYLQLQVDLKLTKMLPEKSSNAEKWAYFLSFGNAFGCVVLLEDNWLLVMTKHKKPVEKLQVKKWNSPILLPAEKRSSYGWTLITCKAKKKSSWTDFQEALKHPITYLQPLYWVFTVPRYPDNHNPLLPLASQRKLEAMGPREFLSYILNELSLEERESLMVDEGQRRRSFQAGWPHRGDLSGNSMARAGFYSVDNYDRVQCVFCRGCLHQWETDDNPMAEHRRHFNFCRFVKGLECGNVSYHPRPLADEDLRNITLFGPQQEIGPAATDAARFNISTRRADSIQYAPGASRIRTFQRWPACAPIAAQRMCNAGFYYTGFDDQVCCFYCSGGIKDWAAADDPWEEHARWFPDCPFLIQQKGQQYVDEVHARSPPNKKCVRRDSINEENNSVQTPKREDMIDMMNVCISLGHNPEVVKKTMANRPEADIKELIDEIYDVEEADDFGTDEESVSGQLSFPSDEDPENTAEMRNQMQPSNENANHWNHTRGACFICENEGRKEGTDITATNMGLPCGHVIYCDRCKEKEFINSQNPTVEVICPYHNTSTGKCNEKLTATMKFYLL